MRLFRNDYSEGAAPEILEALNKSNFEQWPGYSEEGDQWCDRAREAIAKQIGRDDSMIEFCIGGTSANIVAVTGLLREWEGVICTPDAHITTHETGSIAACGRTVLPTRDEDGFLSPEEAERIWQFQNSCGRHMTIPGCLYISNTTELGGVWTRAKFDAICNWADEKNLPIYIDGARLGSALSSEENDLSLEYIASRAAAFSIGGTKNGLLFGEALVISNERLKESFPYLIKERGGLLAKGRLLGVQFATAFESDLYWKLAKQANLCAKTLRSGLVELGFEAYGNSSSNQQFFRVTTEQAHSFEQACGSETFYSLSDDIKVIRFVCSWATELADVEELLAFAKTII